MNPLRPIRQIRGRGIYLPGDDIDTDRIIPARYLKCVTFDGLGEQLFKDERFAEDGSAKPHPLNDPRFAGAEILLSGSNFGCGSSREHAPQALYRHGIRAIVGVSFAEIFFGNSTTLGMPCLQAGRDDIHALARLVEDQPERELNIDLETLTLNSGETTISLELPAGARKAFLAGRWDPIADLMEGAEAATEMARKLPYMAR